MKGTRMRRWVFAVACCSLAIGHAQTEVLASGTCAQIDEALPSAECTAAMGSTSLLQQEAGGVKTEMAWEEENGPRKSGESHQRHPTEKSLLLPQEETMANAGSETLQDENTLPRRRTRQRRQRLKCGLPFLSMANPSIKTKVAKELKLRPVVRFGARSACGRQRLMYSWELSPAVTGLRTEHKDFFIKPKTLKAGVTYTATLTMSYAEDPTVFSTTSASILVVSMPLQAKLKGPKLVGACPGKTVTLKTRLSDPDETSDTVHYTWSSPAGSTQCPDLDAWLAQSTADHAIIPGDTVGGGRSCTVQCVFTKGARNITVTQVVVGIAPLPPVAHFDIGPYGIRKKVSESFMVKASVSTESDCGMLSYQWDFDFPAANPASTAPYLLVKGGIAVAGKYDVSVTVCHSSVCAARITASVVVEATPLPPTTTAVNFPPMGGMDDLVAPAGLPSNLA